MKRVLLGLTLIVGQLAMATSIRVVKLELKTEPYAGFGRPVMTGQTSFVQVLADGAVTGSTCVGITKCTTKEIDRVSSRELARIDRLVKRAHTEALVNPNPGGIHCMAVPSHTNTYSAESRTLVLKTASSPCGGVMLRQGPAATDLIEMLDNFNREYQKQLED